MLNNCFRFAPRDSLPGLIAKICKYLKEHPGWSEEELEERIKQLIEQTGSGGGGNVISVNGMTGIVELSLSDILGDSGAQVKLCTATEFTSSTIETWNAYYESGFRLVCVVNDEATAVDFLYVLKQDVNNHQPIMISSGSGESAVISVNSMIGDVTIPVVDVSKGDSQDIFAKIFINENEDYPVVPADDSYKLGGKLPYYYATSERVNQLSQQVAIEKTERENAVNQLSQQKADKSEIPAPYSLPTASADLLGGVKVDGNGLKIDANGVLSLALADGDEVSY